MKQMISMHHLDIGLFGGSLRGVFVFLEISHPCQGQKSSPKMKVLVRGKVAYMITHNLWTVFLEQGILTALYITR